MWDDNFSAAVDWALALATLVPVLASSGFVRDPRWIFQVLEVEVVVVAEVIVLVHAGVVIIVLGAGVQRDFTSGHVPCCDQAFL